MNKRAQVIMRSYGDRIGKNRLNCDSTLKVSKPPRGNVIITGESTPDISKAVLLDISVLNYSQTTLMFRN